MMTPGRLATESIGTNGLLFGALLVAALLLIPTVQSANRYAGELAKADKKCLKCHSKNRRKTMEDGQKLLLHVAQSELAGSAHNMIACTGCHVEIANNKHPSRAPISSARAYSVDRNEICRDCREQKFASYEGSIHAKLVAGGHAVAPVCTDCHSAHAVESMVSYEPVTGLPCKNCHEDIYLAYAQSVHGKARSDGNIIRASHIQAPICADCHQAHAITPAAAGDTLHLACLNCHDDALLAHDQWLPNSALHLEVVSCAACHAPLAERKIDLELHDSVTGTAVGQHQLNAGINQQLLAGGQAEDGLAPLELWSLVRQANREGDGIDVTLRGRMKVRSGVAAHQLATKVDAVRNCESCHSRDSDAFQQVTVSISRPDGTKRYYQADTEVLNSVVSVDSINDFYAMGGTRIRLLDGLLILALAGGLALPIGHLTLGKWLNRKRQ